MEKISNMYETYHILVTKTCQHKCPYCCNKLFDLDNLPTITTEMLKGAHTVCLTGGEPLMLDEWFIVDLCEKMREQFTNIKKLYVYTSDIGLVKYMHPIERFMNIIDGLNIAPKSHNEWRNLISIEKSPKLSCIYAERLSNRLYVFPEQEKEYQIFTKIGGYLPPNFKVIGRKWDMAFKTPTNEHFVRLPILF